MLSCVGPDGHRPIYTTSTASGVVSVGTDLRKALEPLLLKYQGAPALLLPLFDARALVQLLQLRLLTIPVKSGCFCVQWT